jgi:hypothetical protein
MTTARSLSGQPSLAIDPLSRCVRTGLVRQIVVRGCQVVARAFAFIWSNSAWVIVPASRSCLADAI